MLTAFSITFLIILKRILIILVYLKLPKIGNFGAKAKFRVPDHTCNDKLPEKMSVTFLQHLWVCMFFTVAAVNDWTNFYQQTLINISILVRYIIRFPVTFSNNAILS